MFGKEFGKGSSVVFCCVVGVHYDARCSERLLKVPSTSESSVVRQALGNSIRREDEKIGTYRRDVQARRKDADACCRMTTRLRVRRMKAVPTRLFNWAHSGTSNNTCTP